MITLNLDGGQMLFGLAALVAAVGTIIMPWLALRAAKENTKTIATVDNKVNESKVTLGQLEKTTNSLSERSETMARKLGVEEGMVRGRAAEKADRAADALAVKTNEEMKP